MAKTELDELGESTDDLAGSTAKLQAEIKGLSGVDIMESPTQFKSIYQVFDELATVWDKLTDVQQATIAEKLGGKNGLNTVYSLISNFQTARDVMDEAAESEGSANKELGRAMDSIDGKLAQLSATFQEFANNVVDSDFVKTILSFLNQLGQALTHIVPLVEKLLPALGGIAALKLGSKLKGLFSGGLGSLFSLFSKGGVANIPLQEATSIFEAYQNAGAGADYFAGKLSRSQKILQQYVKQTDVAKQSAADFAAQSGAIATNLGKSALKWNLIGAAIGIAIPVVGTLLDELIVTDAEVKQMADDIKEAYKTASEEISSNTKTVESLADDFNKLSRGVGDYGNNISLTNEQYEQYKDICQTLAKLNPELIKAYDSEGQAIIDKNSAIEKTIELLKEEQRLENVKYTTNKNLETIVKDTFNDLKDTKKEIEDVSKFDLSQSVGDNWQGFIDMISGSLSNPNYTNQFKGIQREIIEDLKYYFNNPDKSFSEAIAEAPEKFLETWNKGFPLLRDELSNYVSGNLISKDTFDNINEMIRDQQEQLNILHREEEGFYRSFENMGVLYASTSKEYENLTQQQQSIVNSMISAFDYEQLANESDNDEKKFVRLLKSKVDNIIKLLSSDREMSNILTDVFKIDSSKVNYEEYRQQLAQITKRIGETSFGKEQGAGQVKVALGLSVKLDDGTIVDEVDQLYDNVYERVRQRFAGDEKGRYASIEKQIQSSLQSLTVDQLKTLYSSTLDDFNSLEEVWNWLTGKTGKFDFADYAEDIGKLKDSLTNLAGAMTKLSDGSLKAQDVADLWKEFPELEGYINMGAKDFGNLADGLYEIAQTKPDELLTKLEAIRETMAGDTTDIDNAIALIKQMQNEVLGLSQSGLYDYGKAKIELVIKELEEANKELEEQKKLLEDITGDYEKTQNAVERVLNDEIESLRDRQTTVKDYYDSQIELLKTENDERERNIDLQEKQKALDDAKKNKVRVYSAARGWTIQSDSEAIRKAQNDLDSTLNDDKITQLEAQRDKADKDIQNSIDVIEAYLKLWEKATTNNLSSLEDREAAKALLGEDWEKKIANGDQSIVNAFKLGYEEEVRKLFGINTQIESNNTKIDTLNTAISTIEGMLSNPEKGLNPIWSKLDTTDLTVSNISTTLDDFVTWIKSEAFRINPAQATEEEVNSVRGIIDYFSGTTSSSTGGDVGMGLGNLANKVMATTPGSSFVSPLEVLSSVIKAAIPNGAAQSLFNPVINSVINTNNIDADQIYKMFNDMVAMQYSRYQAGKI